MDARIHLMVTGSVQGVFFRANTRHFANGLGVKGYVRNLPGGEVEIVAEGRKTVLDKFVEFCKKGPEGAKVENIDIKWEKFKKEFDNFDVRF
jgi:acylphosphatase